MSEFKQLKEITFEGNKKLGESGLVLLTWGNVSAFDAEKGVFAIKPSGVDYDTMTAVDMVVLDLAGNVVEGTLRPSSDTKTHLELYKAYPQLGSVIHTHSKWATVWCQQMMDLPCMGTTHADFFYGAVPCTRPITKEELDEDYEMNTGKIIIETITERGIDPLEVPAILTGGHAPFVWGQNVNKALENSIVLERVAEMAWMNHLLNAQVPPLPQHILDKHYTRKHGKNAYYGQGNH